MTRRRLITGLVLLSLCFTGLALAEDLVRARTMGLVFEQGIMRLYFSARDLIDVDAERKLDSGLPQRIAVQHFVYGARPDEPIAAAGHSCKVVYDLWQAVYRVDHEVLGGTTTSMALRTRAEVLERCLVMRGIPLGEATDYNGTSRIYVATLVQLNPLSSSTVARIRRWLARPRSEYNVETKSFFGSFVSLFVNDRIGAAERVLRLRSQDAELPSWR
jgi:hypothetical protein